uniref:Uncharacterized protein n=1 Tax=Anguilla anguilla TaxID=7936 RepID=A0A0E9X4P0_ANGAN
MQIQAQYCGCSFKSSKVAVTLRVAECQGVKNCTVHNACPSHTVYTQALSHLHLLSHTQTLHSAYVSTHQTHSARISHCVRAP